MTPARAVLLSAGTGAASCIALVVISATLRGLGLQLPRYFFGFALMIWPGGFHFWMAADDSVWWAYAIFLILAVTINAAMYGVVGLLVWHGIYKTRSPLYLAGLLVLSWWGIVLRLVTL